MRIANIKGRAALVHGTKYLYIGNASEGRFSSTFENLYDEWDALRSWERELSDSAWEDAPTFQEQDLGAPSPRPRQVFGLGLNYAQHAEETNMPSPEELTVFTKFPGCITGPYSTVELPSETVDWEVELVVVVGIEGSHIAEEEAWSHVAGLTVGQDLSDRSRQLKGASPQWSLAKSYPGFGPTGPYLVSPDELENPDDLALTCIVNGEVRQSARTADLIFTVPQVIAALSDVCRLFPGDLIFTGTPAGVGLGLVPPAYLNPGDVIETSIEGLGTLRQVCIGKEIVTLKMMESETHA